MEAERSPNFFKLGEQEIAELAFESDDESKEQELLAFGAALGHVPRPAGARHEKLRVHDRVSFTFLRIERRQSCAQLIGQGRNSASPTPTRITCPCSRRLPGRSHRF